MIRITREFIAKPGMTGQLVAVFMEIRGHLGAQVGETRIFTEPWGHYGRIWVHNDFEDAGGAQDWWQHLSDVPRAQEAIARMEGLIMGHREANYLMEASPSWIADSPDLRTKNTVRVVRTFNAKPGQMAGLIEIANDFKSYLASQGITVGLFTEPWGTGGRVHYHLDYPDAGSALNTFVDVMGRQRARELFARGETITEGHMMSSFLSEVASSA